MQGSLKKIGIPAAAAAAAITKAAAILAIIPIVAFVQSGQATTGANQVIDTIQLSEGAFPSGIAFNSDNNRLYVINLGNSEFSIIDDETNEVIDSIEGAGCSTCQSNSGGYITYDSNNRNMYATFKNYGNVSVVDTSDNTISAPVQLPEGAFPSDIAFNSDNNRLYVADVGLSAVHIIDDQTNEVVKTLSVGDGPLGVAYNPVNKKIYVANAGSGTVSVIDSQTDEVVNTISFKRAGSNPLGVAVDTNNGVIYVTDPSLDTISIIRGSNDKVSKSIKNVDNPGVITYGSNHTMYVAGPNSVYVINRNILQTTIPLPGASNDVEYDSHNQNVYVTDNSGAIYVISTTAN